MGKITRKKQRLNYKPILYVAVVAVPALIVITILVRPAKIIPLAITEGPKFDVHLSKAGTFHISWRTNQPASCVVYYRFGSSGRFQEMSTAYGDRFVVAIPGKVGAEIEFYIRVSAGRQEIKSKVYKVRLKKYLGVSNASSKPSVTRLQGKGKRR